MEHRSWMPPAQASTFVYIGPRFVATGPDKRAAHSTPRRHLWVVHSWACTICRRQGAPRTQRMCRGGNPGGKPRDHPIGSLTGIFMASGSDMRSRWGEGERLGIGRLLLRSTARHTSVHMHSSTVDYRYVCQPALFPDTYRRGHLVYRFLTCSSFWLPAKHLSTERMDQFVCACPEKGGSTNALQCQLTPLRRPPRLACMCSGSNFMAGIACEIFVSRPNAVSKTTLCPAYP